MHSAGASRPTRRDGAPPSAAARRPVHMHAGPPAHRRVKPEGLRASDRHQRPGRRPNLAARAGAQRDLRVGRLLQGVGARGLRAARHLDLPREHGALAARAARALGNVLAHGGPVPYTSHGGRLLHGGALRRHESRHPPDAAPRVAARDDLRGDGALLAPALEDTK
eukprot:146989-Prymnesium_polylepis.1